jgi:hypothetical protein
MTPLAPDRLLAVWEAGLARHPLDRALLLFALAAPDSPPETLADTPLGVRNAALLAWRRARSGDRLDAWLECSGCGERLDLALDAATLTPPSAPPGPVTVDGLRFEPLTTRHLAAIAGRTDEAAAVAGLLGACAASPDELPDDPAERERLLATAGEALDEADPWADPRLAVRCPDCGHEEATTLDIPAWLWDELAADALRLLDEVHALARAYGWSETEILGLTETRRRAYLERVCA